MANATRKYKYHFSFQVGGKKHGYMCHIEVAASSQKGAAIKVRNRIAAMPDVVEVPKFHFSEVSCGLPILASAGHDDIGYNTRTRPAPLKKSKYRFKRYA